MYSSSSSLPFRFDFSVFICPLHSSTTFSRFGSSIFAGLPPFSRLVQFSIAIVVAVIGFIGFVAVIRFVIRFVAVIRFVIRFVAVIRFVIGFVAVIRFVIGFVAVIRFVAVVALAIGQHHNIIAH